MWNEFLPISMPTTAIAVLTFSRMACSLSLVPLASLCWRGRSTGPFHYRSYHLWKSHRHMRGACRGPDKMQRRAADNHVEGGMKKPAKRTKVKSSAKGARAKSKSRAKRTTRLKSRTPTKAKTSARRAIPKSRSKLKDVAKKSAKAAIVAAALAAGATALGELTPGSKVPPEHGSNSGKDAPAPAERGSEDREETR